MFKTEQVICKQCQNEYCIYVVDDIGTPLGNFICPKCGTKYSK